MTTMAAEVPVSFVELIRGVHTWASEALRSTDVYDELMFLDNSNPELLALFLQVQLYLYTDFVRGEVPKFEAYAKCTEDIWAYMKSKRMK